MDVRSQVGLDATTPVDCGGGAFCLLKFDTFAPPGLGDAPVVVMIAGGPAPLGNRETMWPLARYVAARGAVVVTADYRSGPQYGGGAPQTFEDVECAVRVARDRAPALGGDPSRVTLVSHSFGGFPAAVVSFAPKQFAAQDGSCVARGDGRPDAFVGVAGVYTLEQVGPEFLTRFFGGTRDEAPEPWAAGDVAAILRDHPHRVPARLVVGTTDLVAPLERADTLKALASDAGLPVDVMIVDGATHESILRSKATVDVVAAVLGLPPPEP